MKALCALISLLVVCQAVFEHTQVQELDDESFDNLIISTDNLWLVFFYNNDVDDALAQTVEQTAMSLRNMVNVGAVNDNKLAALFQVKSFPAFRIFSTVRDAPITYDDQATPQKLVNFVFDTLRQHTFDKIGAKVPKKKAAEKKVVEEDAQQGESSVIILDDENYSVIQDSQDAWFVEFFAPWCDHCTKLEPEWQKLATLLTGEVKIAKIDSSTNTKAHAKFQVKGYPSLKFFPQGDKLDGEWEDYDGSRDANAMANWARETKKKLRPLFFEQLIDHAQFKQNCLDYNGICVIFFVPHIYDTNKEGREKYLKTFKDAVLPHKKKPFNYFWSQGADQYDFEELFGLGGAGYPSVLAISPKKNVWSKMRASFNQNAVDLYIQNLVRGKEQVAPIRQPLVIKTATKWDGEDFKQK